MANLFRGYIPSKGKVPLASVKDKEKWLSEPPTSGDYVGILREDIVQIDFDDEKFSRIAMDIVKEYKLRCDIIKTTRGVHLYFKNNDTIKSQGEWFTACGLKCDVGLGIKDCVTPLRTTKEVTTTKIVDGNEIKATVPHITQREWLQTYEDIETIPSYFCPLGKNDYQLQKSTTRNQTLFEYILKLQLGGFGKDDIRKIIKVINDHILYEPLDDKEIDTITRDEAFSEELFFDDRGRFLHDRFGNYMMSNCNILRIDGLVNIYTKDHLYSNNSDEFERKMVDRIPQLKDNQRKEVYKYIALQCKKEGEFASPKYVGLKSEILDLETESAFPYSPEWIINNRIDFDYDATCYHEAMDKTLTKVCCGDPEIRALFEEMVGYTLYRKNSMQVCFILTGEGSNGKSTILNCVKRLVGKQNYTSLDLRELEDNFKPAELYGKLANIGDDISAKYIENSSVFKKCVTGESFMVNRKYGQPFELESYATQIFCANELPQVNDKSDGFSRRIVIVPFNATFKKTDHDYDPFIEDKLMTDEAMGYLLRVALEGLRRVIINKGFTKSTQGEAEKTEYMKMNNNVLEWIETEPFVEHQPVADVYMAYQVWCTQNGCNYVKKINFSKEIKKHYELVSKPKTVDGKSVRVYEKE